jgi:hypothetical protein
MSTGVVTEGGRIGEADSPSSRRTGSLSLKKKRRRKEKRKHE